MSSERIHPKKLVLEVAQRRKSTLKHDQIVDLVWDHYLCKLPVAEPILPIIQHYTERTADVIDDIAKQIDSISVCNKYGRIVTTEDIDNIAKHIESISVCNRFDATLTRSDLQLFVFKIIEGGSVAEKLEKENKNGNDNGGDQETETAASNHWLLPAREYHGMWESLHFEADVKENLLRFVETSMLFSARNINPHVISCNRLVLLHGPPGTGKTSLSKAIAQKLSIRLANRYRFTHLIEINSHSLFSKWFSESGKLVLKLFDEIKKVLDHSASLVCLLIDEVESIAFARDSVSANEPSDSLRVVNAVLTQLDQIRHRPNLLVLTTSNLTATIDVAFLDRADIRQYIGNPTAEAIYAIYAEAIRELVRAGIIHNGGDGDIDLLLDYNRVQVNGDEAAGDIKTSSEENSNHLLRLANESVGLSGRTLRKLPFLAHALHLQTDTVTLPEYLDAMAAALRKHRVDADQLRTKEQRD